MKTVFVIGGTGFLGSFLISFLLHKGYRVVALIRGPEPEKRLYDVLQDVCDETLEELRLKERLCVVEGDMRVSGLGAPERTLQTLASEVEEIWHCATSFKFQEQDRSAAFSHNVSGTQNILQFTSLCNQGKTVPLFYVSTVCAAPVTDGIAWEKLAPEGAPHRNLYEWSKQEAERLVVQFQHEQRLPALILRPSVIIGHSATGKAVRFTGYYGVLRALALLVRNLEVNLGASFDRNLRLRIIAKPDLLLNLVPIDFVVEAMWRVTCAKKQDETGIFNLASETSVPLQELFHYAMMALRVTGIELVSRDVLQRRPMSGLERLFDQRVQFQAPYLLESPRFDTACFRQVVPREELQCPRIDEGMLSRVNSYYLNVLAHQFRSSGTSVVLADGHVRKATGHQPLLREMRNVEAMVHDLRNRAAA